MKTVRLEKVSLSLVDPDFLARQAGVDATLVLGSCSELEHHAAALRAKHRMVGVISRHGGSIRAGSIGMELCPMSIGCERQ